MWSVGQAVLALMRHYSTSQHCLLLLGDRHHKTLGGVEFAKYKKKAGAPPSPGASSRYHHTNVESTDRACEERGIYYTEYTHTCCRGTIVASTVSLHTRAFLDISATASGVAMPFLSAAPHAMPYTTPSHLSLISSPRGCRPGLGFTARVTCVSCFQILHATRTNTSAIESVSLQGGKKDTWMGLMAPKQRGNAFPLRPA